MSLRPRSRLAPRIVGFLASLLVGALIACYGRTWNEPIGTRRRRSRWVRIPILVLALLLGSCSAVRPWVRFEVPGLVAGGHSTRSGEGISYDVYVVVGRRLVAVDVDAAFFARLRRGNRVIVSGEARGQRFRRLAVRLPVGTDV